MKKILLIGVLVCAILASVVTGTLAVYQVSIDAESGDIIAKTFEFVIGNDQGEFYDDLTIVPGQELNYSFQVLNYNGSTISETDMVVKASFEIISPDGVSTPLEICDLYIAEYVDGNYTIIENDAVYSVNVAANTKTSLSYGITVTWPESADSAKWSGEKLGKLAVKFTATQA